MTSDVPRYPCDEPSTMDALSRENFAKALANITVKGQPPLTIGLYGPWGIGKTSLMQQIKSILINDPTKPVIHTVWFEAWRHEYDALPALGMVQKLAETLDETTFNAVKENIKGIGAGVLTAALKKSTGLGPSDIIAMLDKRDQDSFLVKDPSYRLQEHFSKLLEQAAGKEGKRIVFFVDDLDRCMPEKVIAILESLKLFFNHPRCVTYLAVDHKVLENAVDKHYGESKVKVSDYLNKIIHIPFEIPPIADQVQASYLKTLLPGNQFDHVVPLLKAGLNPNPRAVKRFINQMMLQLELGKVTFNDELNQVVQISLLLLKEYFPDLYDAEIEEPGSIFAIEEPKEEDFGDERHEYEVAKDHYKKALQPLLVELERLWPDAAPMDYSQYTTLVNVHSETQTEVRPKGPEPVVEEAVQDAFTERSHQQRGLLTDEGPTVADDGSLGVMGDDDADEAPELPESTITKADLVGKSGFLDEQEIMVYLNQSGLFDREKAKASLLLLRSNTQRSWLVTTNQRIFLLLDDDNTRPNDNLIQWRLSLAQAKSVTVRLTTRGTRVVDIGPRKGWLYTHKLHPNRDALKKKIETLINQAKAH